MSVPALIEKMRRAREVQAEALGHRFTLRVPNQGEMEDVVDGCAGKRLTYRRLLIAAVVGWDLKEIDLIPGGNPVAVDFDRELFTEWLNDHDDAVAPLFLALSESLEARRAVKEADAKN